MRVALLNSIPTPYRNPVYAALAQRCELQVFFGARAEPHRKEWAASQAELAYPHRYLRTVQVPNRWGDARLGFRETVYMQFSPLVVQELSRFDPQIIIAAAYNPTTVLGELYARAAGKKLIIWSEGTRHTEKNRGRTRQWLRRLLVRNAHGFWTNGPESTELLKDYGYRGQPVEEAMTGVETEFFRSETAGLLPERDALRQKLGVEGVTFLFLGRVVELKGIREMAAALRTVLPETDKTVSLIVAGDGPLLEHLKAELSNIERLRLKALGTVPQKEIPALFSASDVFLLPTLSDNWSLAMLEAAVAGLPQLFSTFNGGSRDLLAKGVGGVLFDPADPADFHRRLLETIENPPPRNSPAATAALAKFYSPAQFAERAMNSMKLVLGE